MNWLRSCSRKLQSLDFGDLREFSRRLRSLLLLSAGGGVCYCGICAFNGDEWIYREAIMPLLRRLDPETAHNAAIWAAKHRITPKLQYEDAILSTSVLGLQFSNPVGLAAGFDKHAEACSGLLRLGFGFVEVGSVTPKPQPGNAKPRIFRLPEDDAIINRYGFNSHGHDVVLARLEQFRRCSAENKMAAPIGVNLGKNKMAADATADFALGVRAFNPLADYLVINVSSPNTPGLRALQHGEDLPQMLERVLTARGDGSQSADGSPAHTPVLLKISPDLSAEQRKHVASCALQYKRLGLCGLIVCNTTVQRPVTLTSDMNLCLESGGLSGRPLNQISTNTIADMYRLTKGEMVIIGVGGVFSGEDAYAKIRAGASLVQIYSSLAVQGPCVVKRIKQELATLLRRDGFNNVAEAVGFDHRKKIDQ